VAAVHLGLALVLATATVLTIGAARPAAPAAAAARYAIVNIYPHDAQAWTEGLVFRKGVLHESTGLYGRSTLRRVDLASGNVLVLRRLSDKLFAEGLTFLGGRAYLLTWREQRALVFDARSLQKIGRRSYGGEGWGLTTNGKRLIMSNGTSTIRFRDPATFAVTRQINVTEGGQPVTRLNELEWIDGRIWANIWLLPEIVIIDPRDGRVLERIDFAALLAREEAIGDPRDMNGIAYLPSAGRIFVTGKYWRNVYEIRLLD
jgi:glutamine cyclotransferase